MFFGPPGPQERRDEMRVRATILGVLCFFLLLAFSSFAVSKERDEPFAHFPLTDADVESAYESGLTLETKKVGLRLKAGSDDLGDLSRVDRDRHGHWLSGGGGGKIPTTGFVVEVFTPYAWIQREASLRAAKGSGMTAEDVTADMRAPVLRILCHPNMPLNPEDGVFGAEVERVSLRSTSKKDYEVLEPTQTERMPTPAKFAAATDIGPLLATFHVEGVSRIADLDKKGEFYIDIVSVSGEEKDLKVKTKHFSRLP
jgi:hypothetical protein